MLELQVDRTANAAYLHLDGSLSEIEHTVSVSPKVNVDYDENGAIIGVEFLTLEWLDNPKML